MTKRILIYRIGNLGDTICAIPAMVAIRRHFQNAWIGLLTNKEEGVNPDPEEILKRNDFLDEIITYHPTKLYEMKYLLTLLKRLHTLKIDLLIYLSLSKSTLQRLIRDRFFFKLSGCRKLVGFKLPKPIKILTDYDTKLLVYPQEVDRLMSLLEPLGLYNTKVEFCLPINKKNKEFVDILWNQHNINNKKPVIAICPGAKFSAKQWCIGRFAEVISKLQQQFDAKIILVGGQIEKTSGEIIIKKVGDSVANIIGETSYMESAEVISRCNLLIANDCGAVHLAAAVRTPVVGIYSSRDFIGAWHPWGKKHTVLRNDSVSCRLCFKTECETKECINSIGVEQVIEACRKYL